MNQKGSTAFGAFLVMNIDSKDEIAGCPALGVRRFLRETMHSHIWDKLWLQKKLALSSQRARLVLEQLSSDGYVEPSPFCKGKWRNTVKGNALAGASAAKPLRRESAESKLDSLLSRVRQVNSPDCDFLYWIEEVVVFGSILTNKSRLSDTDISIRLEKKLEAKEFSVAAERRTRSAAANGRSFRSIVDEVYWPEREVLLFVKSRSRAISPDRMEFKVAAGTRSSSPVWPNSRLKSYNMLG